MSAAEPDWAKIAQECYTAEGKPKRRFDTRAEAKAHAESIPGYNGETRPFRCPTCGYFHMGHYPANPKTRARLRTKHRKDEP